MPRTSSSRALVLAAFLAALLLAGCAARTPSAGETREPAVRKVVQAYNVRLADAFREQDMNVLNTVATRDQAYTEYFQMAALGEGKVRLVSTPLKLRFLSVTFASEDTATVETEETWDYVQVSTETSEVVRQERAVVYHLRYGVVRRDGRWLVDSVRSLETSGAAPGQ